MFDWNRARAFLVTAEEGSLSAAARALGMAQPTLGRQVAALEAELGLPLFDRSGRGLRLTQEGLDLVEHVRAMGEAAGRVSLTATGRSQSVEGPICLTASEVYAVHLLPPVVAALRRDHPGIRVEIVASNAVTDLRRREADIAIRNAAPTDPELIGRRLRDDAAYLYATPGYLDALGGPVSAETLSRAEFIGFDGTPLLMERLNALGLALTPESFPLISGSQLAQWALVKAGLGVGVMISSVGDAEPEVRRALPGLEPIRFPVWLIAHRSLRTSRRVRLVFDRLAAALARG